MADLTRTGMSSLCSTEPPPCFLPPYIAGADCQVGDVLAIHADGFVYPITTSDSLPIGVATKATSAGRSVTAAMHQRFYYTCTASVPIGSALYISTGTAGGLATTAPTSGWVNPVALQVDVDKVQFRV